MSKKTEETKDEESEASKPVALDVDSPEREGNDVASLVGSGAPMVQIRANANIQGLQVGQVGNFIQSEELRLQIQNGLASVVA